MNRTAVKTLAILERVILQKGGMTLTELAQDLQLPASSTHALVSTLAQLHYLHRDPDSKRYEIGFKLLELGQTYLHEMELYAASTPLLSDLCRSLDCVGNIGVFDPGEGVVLTIVEEGGAAHMRMLWKVGRASTLHCATQGKIFLAGLPDEEVERILTRTGMTRFTPNTLTAMATLRRELQQVREQGYALDRQEVFLGMGCVGVPIVVNGCPIGALSIRVPYERLGEIVENALELLKNTAASIGDGVERLKVPLPAGRRSAGLEHDVAQQARKTVWSKSPTKSSRLTNRKRNVTPRLVENGTTSTPNAAPATGDRQRSPSRNLRGRPGLLT